jgi:signal transduction histidine kinase
VDPAVSAGTGRGTRASGAAGYGLSSLRARAADLKTTLEIPDSVFAHFLELRARHALD